MTTGASVALAGRVTGCHQRAVQRYNCSVARPVAQDDASMTHKRHTAFATETTGLLVIAFLLLALVLLGFWRDLQWSFR